MATKPIPGPAELAIDRYVERHNTLLRVSRRLADRGDIREAIRASRAAEILERAALAEERSR